MERRSFLKRACQGLAALFAAVLGVPAAGFLLDPRNRRAPPGDFKRVARLNDLEIGVPTQVVVRDVRRDAWTLHPSDVLGRVWVIRRAADHVDAYTSICPHLGCSINYDGKLKRFMCPCHGGVFDLACRRIEESELGRPNPAPRDMDGLEVQRVLDPTSREMFIEVKYLNFMQGLEERRPKV